VIENSKIDHFIIDFLTYSYKTDNMTKTIIAQLILVSSLIVLIYFMSYTSQSEALYVMSEFDGNEYLMRNLPDKEEAAYLLAVIKGKILILKKYLAENKDTPEMKEFKSYIEQFDSKIKNVVLLENAPDGNYTSYTVNKGDEIALCLRSKQTNELHDINLIMYVVLHELSHVACPEVDHTDLFKKIFIFMLETATKIGIYKYVDYDINPHEYCGLTINENLLANKK
jgi:hypothetical protein